MKSEAFERAYLTAGSAASGAGIAAAVAGLAAVPLPIFVPILGALIGVSATVLSGALDESRDRHENSD